MIQTLSTRPSFDLTFLSWVIFAVVAYYAALFLLSLVRRAPKSTERSPLMVVLVPARNEELVLGETLRALSEVVSDTEYRVLVVNDASTDATAEIAEHWAGRDSRIRLSNRTREEAGQGKSEVLNHAYRLICGWLEEGDPWLDGRSIDDVVAVIVDADGQLGPGALDAVAPYFADPRCASVQIGVRIANARTNLLARMQDIEFVGFSWLVQIARDWIGSSGLGGNGQFTRMSALASLGGDPWRRGALTEDLDLGLRLVAIGWRTRFCHLTYVSQQGLEQWRPLLRQRTRWIQGHYQCWRYIGTLATARRAPLAARLDLILYLVLVVTVMLVSFTVVVGLLGTFGVIDVYNGFLTWIPDGPVQRLFNLFFSLLPLLIFMGTYQRYSAHPFRWHQVPLAGVLFTAYGYVWLWVSLRALTRIAFRRNGWTKTPRVATPAGG